MQTLLSVAAIVMAFAALAIAGIAVRTERRRRRELESEHDALRKEYARLTDDYDVVASQRNRYYWVVDELAASRPLYGHDEDGRYTRVDTSVDWPSWATQNDSED